ncbi:MAG: RNA methyltransferase [Alcaligenaceae bacterium]|nr:RNA methyltransferase [Alcaligenaceae bacterium]
MSFEAKLIDSKSNPTFKRFVKIANNKEKSLCLLEGIHLCQEFLEKGSELRLKQAVFQSGALKRAVATNTPNELKSLYQTFAGNAVVLADNLFKQLCDVQSPQGVFFIVETPQRNFEDISLTENMVLIDRVQDPGNLGTIIRTTAAAGIHQLVLSTGTVNPWSNKVLRSAQGAHFALKIYSDCDLNALVNKLKVPVYAAALNHKADSLYDDLLPKHCAWLFGNEGQGISEELLAQATQHIFIPQSSDVESLNVAVACGIILFEHRRQLLS